MFEIICTLYDYFRADHITLSGISEERIYLSPATYEVLAHFTEKLVSEIIDDDFSSSKYFQPYNILRHND